MSSHHSHAFIGCQADIHFTNQFKTAKDIYVVCSGCMSVDTRLLHFVPMFKFFIISLSLAKDTTVEYPTCILSFTVKNGLGCGAGSREKTLFTVVNSCKCEASVYSQSISSCKARQVYIFCMAPFTLDSKCCAKGTESIKTQGY